MYYFIRYYYRLYIRYYFITVFPLKSRDENAELSDYVGYTKIISLCVSLERALSKLVHLFVHCVFLIYYLILAIFRLPPRIDATAIAARRLGYRIIDFMTRSKEGRPTQFNFNPTLNDHVILIFTNLIRSTIPCYYYTTLRIDQHWENSREAIFYSVRSTKRRQAREKWRIVHKR